MDNNDQDRIWHQVAEFGEVPEGRVRTVSAGTLSMALTHIAGEWPVWQTYLRNPIFATDAILCGAKGVRVTRAEQL